MATLNLTYNTGSVTLSDLNNSLADEWGYQDTIPDPQSPGQMIPNPQSKAEFNRDHVGRYIRTAYRNSKRRAIHLAAEGTVPDIVIT